MKKTKNHYRRKKVRFPDAINASVSREFTIIPNEFLRNPEISAKAKGILPLLLSNREGWRSYMNGILGNMKDGKDSIRNGLDELKQHRYLKIFNVRDKKTKEFTGTIWAYTDTPDEFNFDVIEQELERNKCELYGSQSTEGKSGDGKSVHGKPADGKPASKNNNNKNTNLKTPNKYGTEKSSQIDCDNSNDEQNGESNQKLAITERNKKYQPLAKKLAHIVQTQKNIKYTSSDISKWADSIRKLSEINEVNYSRINTVLSWYKHHIGGEFVPVIESGESLRNKFVKLENAIERDKNPQGSNNDKSNTKKLSNTHHDDGSGDMRRPSQVIDKHGNDVTSEYVNEGHQKHK